MPETMPKTAPALEGWGSLWEKCHVMLMREHVNEGATAAAAAAVSRKNLGRHWRTSLS